MTQPNRGIQLFHLYRHYKGNLYMPTLLVDHHETQQPMVVYRCMSGEHIGHMCVRPLERRMDVEGNIMDPDSWTDRVRWPDGRLRTRFVPDYPGLAEINYR